MEDFQKFGERFKKYLEETPKHLLLIAKHGWFIEIDSELKLPSNIVHEIENGNILIAEEQLIKYYSSNLERIFDELIERHPSRSIILKEIFISHNTENYYTLIPCVLAQVDGICYDFTKKKFFINHDFTEIITEMEKATDNFVDIFLYPLQNYTPIRAGEKYIKNYPCNLNRHEIIHGVNTTYGTKTSSLKCISLLKYVSDLLIEFDKNGRNFELDR